MPRSAATAAPLAQPIPYQGSKRRLAPQIAAHLPRSTDTLYEPFAGSAALTLYAARHGLARRFVLADSLGPLVELWRAIVAAPGRTAARYAELWAGQDGGGPDYYDGVRARFNRQRDPVDLLYLICRCVKNAVRFNAQGHFTQSVDRRRLGTRPERMAAALRQAADLLRGRIELRQGDWRETTADARPQDLIYLDPPYRGTTLGRDKRYHAGLAPEALVEGLQALQRRGLRYALSYDGSTGERAYGPPLPDRLGLTRLHLAAGRSSQATLAGRVEHTVESLYLSPHLRAGHATAAPSGG